VVNGLALTCKFHVWHSWEGPETATGAYGIWCKPAHTVHVVNNCNLNFNFAVQAASCAALVVEATTTTWTTWVMSSTAVRNLTRSDKRKDWRR
jgi:hypothetical protein